MNSIAYRLDEHYVESRTTTWRLDGSSGLIAWQPGIDDFADLSTFGVNGNEIRPVGLLVPQCKYHSRVMAGMIIISRGIAMRPAFPNIFDSDPVWVF